MGAVDAVGAVGDVGDVGDKRMEISECGYWMI